MDAPTLRMKSVKSVLWSVEEAGKAGRRGAGLWFGGEDDRDISYVACYGLGNLWIMSKSNQGLKGWW